MASGARVWLASGHTDMRRGMRGLALQVQEGFDRDPFAGDVYLFRGRSGSLLKARRHDGIGLSNNAAERALRGLTLGRKAWLFAGNDRGGQRAAMMYSLITMAK